MKPTQRLFDLIAQLPTRQRVAIALALADVSQELLTAKTSKGAEPDLEELAVLEIELRELPPSERVDVITQRMHYSRATYFRKRKQLINAGLLQSHSLTKSGGA